MDVPRAWSGSKAIAFAGVASMVTVCPAARTRNDAPQINTRATALTRMVGVRELAGCHTEKSFADKRRLLRERCRRPTPALVRAYYIVLMLHKRITSKFSWRLLTSVKANTAATRRPHAYFSPHRISGRRSRSPRHLRRHHGHP